MQESVLALEATVVLFPIVAILLSGVATSHDVTARLGSAQNVPNAGTVVSINGETVTSAEFAHLIRAAANGSSAPLATLLTPDVVVQVVDEVLAAQQGRLLGYAMTDEQFDRVVENLRKNNQMQSDEQFEVALVQAGLSRTDLRRNLERQMIFNRLKINTTGWDDNLSALRSRASIVWFDDNLRQTYEAGLRVRP